MPYEVTRDFVGYGANPPDPQWPSGAKIAVNFVMNYEEGSEPSFELGDGRTEAGLTESLGGSQVRNGRDLAAESMFEYGSRVGVWRLLRTKLVEDVLAMAQGRESPLLKPTLGE